MGLFHLLMPRCGAKKGSSLLGLLWPNGKTIRAVVPPTTSFVLQLWPLVEAQGKGTRPQADRVLALSIHCSVPAILSRGHLQGWLGLFMVQPPMTLPQVRFPGHFSSSKTLVLDAAVKHMLAYASQHYRLGRQKPSLTTAPWCCCGAG